MSFGKQKILKGLSLLIAIAPAIAQANGTATATLTAVNAGYSNTTVTPSNIYFPVQATGGINASCVGALAYYNSGLSVGLDPAVTTSYFIFDVTPSVSLSTINGGTDPASSDTLVVKAEPEGSSTPIDLFPVDGSSMVTASSTEIQLGTTSRTVRLGLRLNNGSATDFCSQYNGTVADCQHNESSAPAGFAIRIGFAQKGTFLNTSSTANYAQVNVIPVNCPILTTPTTAPLDMTLTATPLDGKVKLSNFTPTPTSSLIPLQGMMLFATKSSSSQYPLASAFLKKQKVDSPDAGQYTFEGLDNDTRYCFSLSYINYGGFLSVPNPISTQTALCATPSKIEGFLNRSTCFVATAAYGSEMDSHVELLRQFRNQVLLKNPVGVKFVAWYYSWSPKAADYIRERPLLRAAVRYALSPLIITAKVSLWLKKHF